MGVVASQPARPRTHALGRLRDQPRPSVHPYLLLSVRPSVRPSVPPSFLPSLPSPPPLLPLARTSPACCILAIVGGPLHLLCERPHPHTASSAGAHGARCAVVRGRAVTLRALWVGPLRPRWSGSGNGAASARPSRRLGRRRRETRAAGERRTCEERGRPARWGRGGARRLGRTRRSRRGPQQGAGRSEDDGGRATRPVRRPGRVCRRREQGGRWSNEGGRPSKEACDEAAGKVSEAEKPPATRQRGGVRTTPRRADRGRKLLPTGRSEEEGLEGGVRRRSRAVRRVGGLRHGSGRSMEGLAE